MPKRQNSIFDATKNITPRQIETVAQRRYADAMFLLNEGSNARLNAAMYLGGFVIECLLKARLLEKYTKPGNIAMNDKQASRLGNLIFRSHDLHKMLAELPEIELQFKIQDAKQGTRLLPKLMEICNVWTIYARYSSRQANRSDAEEFLKNIGELKRCL